jgi:hypothetical protein
MVVINKKKKKSSNGQNCWNIVESGVNTKNAASTVGLLYTCIRFIRIMSCITNVYISIPVYILSEQK